MSAGRKVSLTTGAALVGGRQVLTLFFLVPQQQLRIFSPVILFHDPDYKDHHHHNHSSIPYGDQFHQDDQTIEVHKRRISRMLENNGRFWSDIITWSRGKEYYLLFLCIFC
jgi:hypothetical protein